MMDANNSKKKYNLMKEKADDTIINQFLNTFITTMPMSAMNPNSDSDTTTSSLNTYT